MAAPVLDALTEAEEALLRADKGVTASAVTVAAAAAIGVTAFILVTSISKPAQDSIPSLLPSWFTANDSQWSARSDADREKRWHRETPAAVVAVMVVVVVGRWWWGGGGGG